MFPLLFLCATVDCVNLTAENPFADGVASQLVSVGSPCDSYPCWNDGGCFIAANDSYTCLCKEGFAGLHCELRTPKTCSPNPCSGDDFCFVDGGDIECFPARLRNILMPCARNLCRNMGDCLLIKGAPRCFCLRPFHGTFCEDSPNGDMTFIRSSRSSSGGNFVVGMTALCVSAFMSVIVVLLVCNLPNCTCYLLLPYRNYDRWRTHDNSARSIDRLSRTDEFDHFVIPLQRLERLRIRRTSGDDGKSSYTLGVHRSVAPSDTRETIAPAISPIVSVASQIT